MELVYKFMAIFLNFSTTSNHLHPHCRNSRLVVDECNNGKFRLEIVKALKYFLQTIETKGFFPFKIIIIVLFCFCFACLYLINILILPMR